MGCTYSNIRCCKRHNNHKLTVDVINKPIDTVPSLQYWETALKNAPYQPIIPLSDQIQSKLLKFATNISTNPLINNSEIRNGIRVINYIRNYQYFTQTLHITPDQYQYSMVMIDYIQYIDIAKYLFIVPTSYNIDNYFANPTTHVPTDVYYVYLQYGTSCTGNAAAFAYNYIQRQASGNRSQIIAPSRDYIWYWGQQLTGGQAHVTNTVGTSLVQAVVGTTLNNGGMGVCDESVTYNHHVSGPIISDYTPTVVGGQIHYYPISTPEGKPLPTPTNVEENQGKSHYTTKYSAVKMNGDATDISTIKWILFWNVPFMFRFAVFNNFYTQSGNKYVPIPPNQQYTGNSSNQVGWHSVAIVGWNDNYTVVGDDTICKFPVTHYGAFLCRNSWGPVSGDNGHFWIPYDYFTTGLTDSHGYDLITECVVINSVHTPISD
jgi:hypothetical protein